MMMLTTTLVMILIAMTLLEKKSVFITFREIVLNFAEFGRMFRIRLSRPNSKELISDCRGTESH